MHFQEFPVEDFFWNVLTRVPPLCLQFQADGNPAICAASMSLSNLWGGTRICRRSESYCRGVFWPEVWIFVLRADHLTPNNKEKGNHRRWLHEFEPFFKLVRRLDKQQCVFRLNSCGFWCLIRLKKRGGGGNCFNFSLMSPWSGKMDFWI